MEGRKRVGLDHRKRSEIAVADVLGQPEVNETVDGIEVQHVMHPVNGWNFPNGPQVQVLPYRLYTNKFDCGSLFGACGCLLSRMSSVLQMLLLSNSIIEG